MKSITAKFVFGIAFALVLAAVYADANRAKAALLQVDFTVDYSITSTKFGSSTTPFGVPPVGDDPTFSGSFQFDDAGIGSDETVLFSDRVTALSLQTGTKSWSSSDVIASGSPDGLDRLVFDGGSLFNFGLFLGDTGGELQLQGINSFNLSEFTGPVFPDRFTSCNGCVSFEVSEVAPIPLPAALPMFAGSLGLLGLLGWRRRKAAAA